MNDIQAFTIEGVPSKKQQEFFDSRAKYIAYGGARGGGKSWALRRKLVCLCLRYPGIKCLIIRRSYPELVANHVQPMLAEYGPLISYSESEKTISFDCSSSIKLGYCSCDRDTLRYQGQEYDIIAIDEATQISEYQFGIFTACLRGTNSFPRRMYLTCNPGGIGHAWVKRLFIDKVYREGENKEDYEFIQSLVYDNDILMNADPDYVKRLEALPEKQRAAWLYGRWDIFDGQFFPEFDSGFHVVHSFGDTKMRHFIAFDYGFDMLAALLIGYDPMGNLYVKEEFCSPSLTLSMAADAVSRLASKADAEYAVASPDLWNRRQDSGKSGFEIMSEAKGMPPLLRADNRRVPGWRVLRNMLGERNQGYIKIANSCTELIRSIPALLFDKNIPDDASSHPHDITHAPEALRYAVMSRLPELFTEKDDFIIRRPEKANLFF
ncbi:MAG: phage terminase large subunit [Clostridia bacterium]|nr:phage terminase large subunit [Clostridia bacterium]